MASRKNVQVAKLRPLQTGSRSVEPRGIFLLESSDDFTALHLLRKKSHRRAFSHGLQVSFVFHYLVT